MMFYNMKKGDQNLLDTLINYIRAILQKIK